MRRICLSLSLLLIFVVAHPESVMAQGIGEMGGAYGISSGQSHGLMNSGTTGAMTGTMNNAVKNINASTSGAASTAKSTSSSSSTTTTGSSKSGKGSTLRDGEEPPTPAQTAKKAGDMSNKLYIDGLAKYKAGNYESADKLFRQSLYYRESIWGTKDPAVPKIYDILGDIARKRAAPVEAENCYHKALTGLIKQYGPGDYVMEPVLSKLGGLYLETFKFSDAVNAYQQVYTLDTRKFGEDNEQTVGAVINLSKSYLGDEQYREASRLLHEYATRLDKGQDSNFKLLSGVLELYQTALQKTNQTETLQRVQTRAQEVTDLLASQTAKDESKSAAPDAGTESGASAPATATTGSIPAAPPAVTPAAPPATPAASTPAAASAASAPTAPASASTAPAATAAPAAAAAPKSSSKKK